MSVSRPANYVNWTDGSSSKQVQPPANFLLQGWTAGQAPPFQYANWQIWLLDQWIQYLDQLTNTGVPDQVIRLIGGGNWSFVASTGVLSWSATAYLAIASVADADNTIAAGSLTLADGDVGYVTANAPILVTGNTTSGSNQITNLSFTGNLETGMAVTGLGIPASTTVTGIGSGAVTISNNATSNNTGATYTFNNASTLTPTAILNTLFIPSFTTIMFVRRVGALVYIGVNGTQMSIQDGESKPLSQGGYLSTFTATAGVNLTAGQPVYVSSAADGRTTGNVYPVDAGVTNGALRSGYSGFVISSVTSGSAATVVTAGFIPISGLTVGALYYVNPATPGAITTTKPTTLNQYIVPVGFAISSTVLAINAALASNISQFGSSGGGGGGGSALIWVEGLDSPTPSQLNGNQVYSFDPALGQNLTASLFVPNNYIPGSPIKLRMLVFSTDTTNNLLFQTVATLIRTGVDANGSTTNQRTSTNSAITLSSGTNNINQQVVFDLTDTSGNINSVAVSPGDLIEVELLRGTDTSTLAADALVYACTPTFS